MNPTVRIGILVGHDEPYWVQVREVLWQRARTLGAEPIDITIEASQLLSNSVQAEVVEDLTVQELDALICNMHPPLLAPILDSGLPIIFAAEIPFRHPQFSSQLGTYDAGYMLGTFLHERLAGLGTLLVVGGYVADNEDNGQSRLDGFFAALPTNHSYAIHHVQSGWSDEDATRALAAYFATNPDLQIDAIFGLSDALAIAARDICESLGHSDNNTLVVGVNGDPLALASIADGRMAATVEIDVDDMAKHVVDLAYRAACGEPIPPHFRNHQRLVTTDNVADVATRKLLSLASLPTRLVQINRRNAKERITQRETSLAIDRKVGLILNEQQLSLAITGLIRDTYGFDHARFLIWNEHTQQLVEVGIARDSASNEPAGIALTGPLEYVFTHGQTVLIPDTYRSSRFAPDPLWPAMHARVVVPVHLGGKIVGILDLHRHEVTHYTHNELAGLELLADRLAISIRNAELYSEALQARGIAEKADRLKTVLLTNVSHELRTPLNVILGYSRATLEALTQSSYIFDPQLSQHVTHIYSSAEHLLRLINDLLDLSRAEIDELDLLPEKINTHGFLEAVFEASTTHFGAHTAVRWNLDLPPELPPIEADSVRLRQVLLNLLHNAHKFTEHGQITLGACMEASELHLWVADTGTGICDELQEQIFEPFISVDTRAKRHEGIGLGLSIARRLVALHRGRMQVESKVGHGSTFHIYLPLPSREDTQATQDRGDQPVLLLMSNALVPPVGIVELAERRGLTLRMFPPGDQLTDVLKHLQPALLVCDLATTTHVDWRVVEQIRSHAHGAQIPILMYESVADGTFDKIKPMTGVLLKSLGDSSLIEALEHLRQPSPQGNILVVEDDPQLRALHCRIIRDQFPNYVVRDVGDGAAALEMVNEETPDLIVLDLVMPEVDGFAVLKSLRSTVRTASVPVLVLSGKMLGAEDISRLAEARVMYQTKDILAESELTGALRRTLTREESLPSHTSAVVKQAIGFIQQHYHSPITLQEIADALGVNRYYLGRIFQQELGLSPWQYLIRYRVLRAKELLQTTSATISQIATQVGFDTSTYFSHIFHREVGCSPRTFRTQFRN